MALTTMIGMDKLYDWYQEVRQKDLGETRLDWLSYLVEKNQVEYDTNSEQNIHANGDDLETSDIVDGCENRREIKRLDSCMQNTNQDQSTISSMNVITTPSALSTPHCRSGSPYLNFFDKSFVTPPPLTACDANNIDESKSSSVYSPTVPISDIFSPGTSVDCNKTEDIKASLGANFDGSIISWTSALATPGAAFNPIGQTEDATPSTLERVTLHPKQGLRQKMMARILFSPRPPSSSQGSSSDEWNPNLGIIKCHSPVPAFKKGHNSNSRNSSNLILQDVKVGGTQTFKITEGEDFAPQTFLAKTPNLLNSSGTTVTKIKDQAWVGCKTSTPLIKEQTFVSTVLNDSFPCDNLKENECLIETDADKPDNVVVMENSLGCDLNPIDIICSPVKKKSKLSCKQDNNNMKGDGVPGISRLSSRRDMVGKLKNASPSISMFQNENTAITLGTDRSNMHSHTKQNHFPSEVTGSLQKRQCDNLLKQDEHLKREISIEEDSLLKASTDLSSSDSRQVPCPKEITKDENVTAESTAYVPADSKNEYNKISLLLNRPVANLYSSPMLLAGGSEEPSRSFRMKENLKSHNSVKNSTCVSNDDVKVRETCHTILPPNQHISLLTKVENYGKDNKGIGDENSASQWWNDSINEADIAELDLALMKHSKHIDSACNTVVEKLPVKQEKNCPASLVDSAKTEVMTNDSATFEGFSTGMGKKIKVSSASLDSVKMILKTDDFEMGLDQDRNNLCNTGCQDNFKISAEKQKLTKKGIECMTLHIPNNPGSSLMFKKASGASVLVTSEALSKAKAFLADENVSDNTGEKGKVDIFVKSDLITNTSENANSGFEEKMVELQKLSVNLDLHQNSGSCAGFRTAAGIEIMVNTESLQRAKYLCESDEIKETMINSSDVTEDVHQEEGLGVISVSRNNEPIVSEEDLKIVEHVWKKNEDREVEELAAFDVDSTKKLSQGTLVESTLKDDGVERSSPKRFTKPEAVGGSSITLGSIMKCGKESLNRAKTFWEEDKTFANELAVSEKTKKNIAFGGFSTASGHAVRISDSALRKAKFIWEENRSNDTEELTSSISVARDSHYEESTKLHTNTVSKGCDSSSCDKNLNTSKELQISKEKIVGLPFGGFSTASGNKVIVSVKAVERAKGFLKEDEPDGVKESVDSRSGECIAKSENSIRFSSVVGKEIKAKMEAAGKSNCSWEELKYASVSDTAEQSLSNMIKKRTVFEGFSTASGQNIKINKGSLKIAKSLWEECIDEITDAKKDALSFSGDSSDLAGQQKMTTVEDHNDGIEGSGIGESKINSKGNQVLQVDDLTGNTKGLKRDSEIHPGFATASGAPVKVNKDSLKRVHALFADAVESITGCSHESSELNEKMDLIDVSSKRNENLTKPRKISNACKIHEERDETKDFCTKSNKMDGDYIGIQGKANSNLPSGFTGFSTAGGGRIKVNESALSYVKNIFQEDDANTSHQKCGDSSDLAGQQKMMTTGEDHNGGIEGSGIGESKINSKGNQGLQVDDLNGNTKGLKRDSEIHPGFATASGAPVKVNKDSLKRVHALFADAVESVTGCGHKSSELNEKMDLIGVSSKSNKNLTKARKISNACKIHEERDETKDFCTKSSRMDGDYVGIQGKANSNLPSGFTGFSTAGGGRIKVNESALSYVKNIFQEDDANTSHQKCNKEMFCGDGEASSQLYHTKHHSKEKESCLKYSPRSKICEVVPDEVDTNFIKCVAKEVVLHGKRPCLDLSSENDERLNSSFPLGELESFKPRVTDDPEADFNSPSPVMGSQKTIGRCSSPVIGSQASNKRCLSPIIGSQSQRNRPSTRQSRKRRKYNASTCIVSDVNSLEDVDDGSTCLSNTVVKDKLHQIDSIKGNERRIYSSSRSDVKQCKSQPEVSLSDSCSKSKTLWHSLPADWSDKSQASSSKDLSIKKRLLYSDTQEISSMTEAFLRDEPWESEESPVKKRKAPEPENNSKNLDISGACQEKVEHVYSVDDGVKEVRELIRMKLENVIRYKKKHSVQPQQGILHKKRMDAKNKRIRLRSLGIPKLITCRRAKIQAINGNNASQYRFPVEDEREGSIDCGESCRLIPGHDNRIGASEVQLGFLAMPGVSPQLVPDGWVLNHYRWIVWSLAALERRLIEQNVLTLKNLISRLKYRYDREIDRAERPVLRKIIERDDIPQKTMILCVVDIKNEDKTSVIIPGASRNASHDPLLTLTDGWYCIGALVDDAMKQILKEGKIDVGTKLVIHGAELTGPLTPCHPLEASSSLKLRLHTNMTRKARWWARLGLQPQRHPLPIRLSAVLSNGGMTGQITAMISRVYPLVYFERSNGNTMFRGEKAHLRLVRENQEKKETTFHQMVAEVEKEFERDKTGGKRDRRNQHLTNEEIHSLISGKEIAQLMEESLDPTNLQDMLSVHQIEIARSWQQKQIEEKRQRINAEVQKRLKNKSKVYEAVPLLKVRLVDMDGSGGLLTIWRPSEELKQSLLEGLTFNIHYAVAAGFRQGCLQLTATRQTHWERVNRKLIIFPELERCITPICLTKSDELVTPWKEIDVVGLVFRISQIDHGSQMVHITDHDVNVLALKFWGGLKDCGVEDIINTGTFICVSNGSWQGYGHGRCACVHVTELTSISVFPRSPDLAEAVMHLKNSIKDKTALLKQADMVLDRQFDDRTFLGLAKNTKSNHDCAGDPKSSHDSSVAESDEILTSKNKRIKEQSKEIQNKLRILDQYGPPSPMRQLPESASSLEARRSFRTPFKK